MPLLCPRVYILLLLLPLIALSCRSTKSINDIKAEYNIIHLQLSSATKSIEDLLKNTTCPDLSHNVTCSSSRTSHLVTTMFNIICRMKNLNVSETTLVTESVHLSFGCPCPKQSTKEPKKRDRIPGNEKQKHKKLIKKLCRAHTLLSSLSECYELLNTIISTGTDT